MKWNNKGHEFDDLLQADGTPKEKEPIYLWGAGQVGQKFLRQFTRWVPVVGMIDSDPEKQGEYLSGYPIYPPAVLEKKEYKVVITLGNPDVLEKVESDLQKFGYEKNKDYFIDIVRALYDYRWIHCWIQEKVDANNFTVKLTTRCSLSCIHCIDKNPVLTHQWKLTVEEAKENLDTGFQWVYKLDRLQLVGGDALLYPDLEEIVTYVGETYRDRCRQVHILTNAVVMPSRSLLELMVKYKMFFRVTNYRGQGKQNVPKLIELAEQYDIYVEVFEMKEWIDFSLLEEPLQYSKEELSEKVRACFMNKEYFTQQEGKFPLCDHMFTLVATGYDGVVATDYFDLKEYRPERIREFIEFNMGYSETDVASYCAWCKGLLLEGVPCGEQQS